MVTIAQAVQKQVKPGCCQQKISKSSCAITLSGNKRLYLLIDMDHKDAPSSKGRKKCDYLFFGKVPGNDSEWVMPLELKKGGIKPEQVVEQLQAGAAKIDCLIPPGVDFEFRPVVASGQMHRNDLKHFSGNKIKLRGKKEVVRRIKCGDPLQAALTKK